MFYIRNKQKQETDFLIAQNDKPWLLVEAKLSDGTVEPHHLQAGQALHNIPIVQVCRQPGVAALQKRDVYRLSAMRLFA